MWRKYAYLMAGIAPLGFAWFWTAALYELGMSWSAEPIGFTLGIILALAIGAGATALIPASRRRAAAAVALYVPAAAAALWAVGLATACSYGECI